MKHATFFVGNMTGIDILLHLRKVLGVGINDITEEDTKVIVLKVDGTIIFDFQFDGTPYLRSKREYSSIEICSLRRLGARERVILDQAVFALVTVLDIYVVESAQDFSTRIHWAKFRPK